MAEDAGTNDVQLRFGGDKRVIGLANRRDPQA